MEGVAPSWTSQNDPRDSADVTEAPLLLQPFDVAQELGCSPSRVRDLADDGTLRVAARTKRGGRLFRATDVERLKAARGGGKH